MIGKQIYITINIYRAIPGRSKEQKKKRARCIGDSIN
jgi:hypothetical protein